MKHYFKRVVQIVVLVAIVAVSSYNGYSQGDYDKILKARDTLFTQGEFTYRDTTIDVLDLSYHLWSADGVTWRKNYVLGDRYVKFSNDVKNTYATIDLFDRYWVNSGTSIYNNQTYSTTVLIDTTGVTTTSKLWVNGNMSATDYYYGATRMSLINLFSGAGNDGYVLTRNGNTAQWLPMAGDGGSTARNVGTEGYGVFEDSLLTELQFRNIASADTFMELSLSDSNIYLSWDGSGRILTAGVGLSGGGDLGANRTINLYVPELPTLLDTIDYANDWLVLNDASDGTHYKVHPQDLIDVIGFYEDSIGIEKDGNKFYLGTPWYIGSGTVNAVFDKTHSHEFRMYSYDLVDLGDVDNNPTAGQYLKWNGTNWVTDSPSAGISNVDLYVDSVLVESDVDKINVVGDGITATYLGDGGVKLTPVADTLFTTIAISDETTALTVGTAKRTFRMPYACTLTKVRASVATAPTGANLIFDIKEGGSSVLSTLLSIDATEKTSKTATSAAVISDSSIADDAEITIDITQIGSTVAGAGAKIVLYYVKN